MFLGLQPFFNDAIAGAVTNVKASGVAQLWALRLVNTVAAASYLQIFFKPAASVTLGTTVPDFVIRLQTSESLAPMMWPVPLQKDGGSNTGLSIAGTTTPTGNTGAAISVSALFA
jgi:hypothetical protein